MGVVTGIMQEFQFGMNWSESPRDCRRRPGVGDASGHAGDCADWRHRLPRFPGLAEGRYNVLHSTNEHLVHARKSGR